MISKTPRDHFSELAEEVAGNSDADFLQTLMDKLKDTARMLADARAAVETSRKMLSWFK